MAQHFYVYESEPGQFCSGPKFPQHAAVHGRFTTQEEAQALRKKLKRDYLSPMPWADGTPLTIKERVIVGVWGWDPAGWPYPYRTANDAATGSATLVQGIVGEEVHA